MQLGNHRIKEIGVSHARGMTAYFSLDQTRTFSTYRREGSGVIRHQSIDELFKSRRDAGDDRIFVAILEGSLQFLQDHRKNLTIPQLIVYVANIEILCELEVIIVDEKWKSSQTKIDLNDYLPN